MSKAPISSRPSPYKGLSAFEDTEQDALFFFGRERETEVIAANILASRFTVLYGPLGVGKSSVLRAGVVRRLRTLAPDAVVVAHDSWAGDAVGDVLHSVAGAPDVETSHRSLADLFAEFVGRTGADVLLVLDQFEELFVYPDSAAFADALAEVVTRPDLRVNVLLALREDALSELDVFTGRIPNVFGNYLALEPLDRTAARAAVTGPIERYNELTDGPPVEIENELVEAVLDQVEVGRVLVGGPNGQSTARGEGGGQVEAAYLQLVLERLWEAEGQSGSRLLRRTTLNELGGAEQIVRAHLDEAIEALAPEQRDVAARVFHHLVTPSGTKIAHGADDLAQYAGVRTDELLPVLTALGGRRIVRPVDGRFEIFHDVLANAVLSWRTRHDAERELDRERAAAERRHRRLLVLLVASLAALAAMAAVTIYALTQRSEAREQAAVAREEATRAKASELAAQASVLIPITAPSTDPELGLLLAAEAVRLSPDQRTVGVLRRALLLSHLRAVFPERDVTTASLSQNGAQVVVGTESGVVRVYTADGRQVLTTLRLRAPATGASFGPDERLVLTTERGGPARVWEAATGAELLALGSSPESASFNSDGSRILTADDGVGRVWNTEDGTAVATLRQPDPVRQASFGPGGARVVTTGAGALARVFDVRTRAVVAVVDHGGAIDSAALIADDAQLVTTGADRPARIWTLRGRGRLVRELPEESTSSTPAALAPDGDLLVTTASDVARVWAVPSGRLVADLVGHRNVIAGAAFSPDGRSLVTWDVDGTALVWDPIAGSARVALAGHGAPVTGAVLDVGGDVVLTTSAGRARRWSGRVQSDLELLARVQTPVTAATFSDDGSTLAVADPSRISVLQAANGEEIGSFEADRARALALNSDGSRLAAATAGEVSVWRVPDRDAADPVGGTATALAFSPDHSRLALGSVNQGLRVVTLSGGDFVDLPRPGRVTSVAFSPSGETVAAGFAKGTLAAWSLDGGRLLFQVREHVNGTAVTSVAFDATGTRLVTAGSDSTVRVWDARTGRALYALRGHYRWVGDAAFSGDGAWIVSAGSRVAGLWDLASRQRFLFLRGHEGRVHEATFDGTGRRITTVGGDGTVRVYRCEVCADVPALLRLAERRLEATGRTLTLAERSRYLGGG